MIKVQMTEQKKKQPVIARTMCAGCSLCVENCPLDCLRIEEPKYHGDIHTIAYLAQPERCVGCGLCARACPIRAIAMIEK